MLKHLFLPSAGGPCLTALVAGEAAERFEEQGSAESVAKAMAALRTIFAPKKIQVPPPVQVIQTPHRGLLLTSSACGAHPKRCMSCVAGLNSTSPSPSTVQVVGMCLGGFPSGTRESPVVLHMHQAALHAPAVRLSATACVGCLQRLVKTSLKPPAALQLK